jgi:signal transduction histidine kinase
MSRVVPKAVLAVLRHLVATNEVVCLRAVGVERKRFDPFSGTLRFSFVGDVLSGREFGRYRVIPRSQSTDPLVPLMASLGADHLLAARLQSNTLRDPIGVFAFFPSSESPADLSATRSFQQQVQALAIEIDRSALDARVAQHQRAISAGSLLLGMTHELKNAISALRLQAAHLEAVLAPDNRSAAARWNESIDCQARLSKQIEDLQTVFESLLGMVRIGGASQRPISQLVLEVVRQCHPAAEKDDITLWMTDTTVGERSVYPVRATLAQVVMNLILNAIQHTRMYRHNGGFVQVTLSEEKVDGRRWLYIRVRDNGFGIDGLRFGRIFCMFETTRRDGSGLGLYVSRMLVNGMGGEIFVEKSHKYLGTTMAVRMPMK